MSDIKFTDVMEYKGWQIVRHEVKNLYYIERDGQRHGPFISTGDCRVYVDMVSQSTVGFSDDVGRS